MDGLDMGAIVGDQAGERHEALSRRLDQRQCEPRFAGPGRALDQHRARADQNGGGVDRGPAITRSSLGRQPHREAGAEHLGLGVAGRDRGAVLGPQPAAVGVDDLLGDRQAEPGVLAEALLRAVGCRSARRSCRRPRD